MYEQVHLGKGILPIHCNRPVVMAKGLIIAGLPLSVVLLSLYVWPLTGFLTPSSVQESHHHLNSLFRRISDCLPTNLFFCKRFLRYIHSGDSYETYDCPEAEAAYWRQAKSARRQLASSDARSDKRTCIAESHTQGGERQILYYVPRLLPEYREKCPDNIDSTQYQLPLRIFMEWCMLVYPKQVFFTTFQWLGALRTKVYFQPRLNSSQASKLMTHFSNRDLQTISRIMRKARVGAVRLEDPSRAAGPPSESIRRQLRNRSRRCRKEWKRWTETKGPDFIISFEQEEEIWP